MSKQFKVGPAKLRNGNDAYIYELIDGQIFGRYKLQEVWTMQEWSYDGSLPPEEGETDWDLMSNVEPESYVFESAWKIQNFGIKGHLCRPFTDFDLFKLAGKRTRVEITVLDDNEHVCDHPDCEGNMS